MTATPHWIVLSVLVPPAGEEVLLVDALRRAGARAVERDGARFEAVVPGTPNVDRLVRDAEALIRASTTLTDPAIRWRSLDADAWARRWREEQGRSRITDRIVVEAAEESPGPRGAGRTAEDPAEVTIRLEPATAFGTAEHPTTRACLRFLDAVLSPGDRVLDAGTGSGILAIAAALLGARRVTALDADPLAVDAARRNADRNGVARRVGVRERTIRPGRRQGWRRYDGVVANIPGPALIPMIPSLARSVAPGGWLILSGLLRTEREAAVASASDAGLELLEEDAAAGWWTGWFGRTG